MVTVIKLVLFADTISNLSSLRGRTSNRYKNYSTKLILIVLITVFILLQMKELANLEKTTNTYDKINVVFI